jgi:hypothetical protein
MAKTWQLWHSRPEYRDSAAHGEVRHIELSPDEAQALLERLQHQSKLRQGPYTVMGRDKPAHGGRLKKQARDASSGVTGSQG